MVRWREWECIEDEGQGMCGNMTMDKNKTKEKEGFGFGVNGRAMRACILLGFNVFREFI